MRILITGGAGFIGSNVTDAFLAAGHDVAVIDDLSSGSADNIAPRARVYRVDIRDAALDGIFAEERPEVVCHHAAQVSVRRSVEAPQADAEINVLGSLNVFGAARRHGTRRLVFASTGGAIYGETPVCADETVPVDPQSNYGKFKAKAEKLVDSSDLRAVTLRLANIYGPRQRTDLEGGVIAIFIGCWKRGEPITLFGDGEQVRDFVYVEDVVTANLAALRVATPRDETAIFNIGTGRATTVNALWRVIEAVARPTVGAYYEPVRSGDVRRSVLDPSRAARELGWRAAVDVENGLARTWAWFLAQAGRTPAEAA